MNLFLKKKNVFVLSMGILFSFLTGCSSSYPIDAEYTFSAATQVEQSINEFEQVHFEPIEDLNLGFFRGNVWIKLDITNVKSSNMSYMFVSNDRFNRDYKFYKLDELSHQLMQINYLTDTLYSDSRTYNRPNANLKIDLEPNEHATFLITSASDGRTKDATPKIISLENYYAFISENTIGGIIFYAAILILFIINIYLWRFYKKDIYLYYLFYILSTFFVYLGIEGYLLTLKINQLYIDHFIFVSVKLWALSLIIYTAQFLEIDVVAPKYYRLIKIILTAVLGGTLLYQFVWFNSSIQYLHYYENLLTFLWLLMLVGMIGLSAKKRWLELKYYLIPFAFFIGFTVFGIVNVHLQLLAGNSFTYVKIGAIFEFIGFTYFTTLLIKRRIEQSELLAKALAEKEALLSKKIDSTELIGIFSLIENSLSTENEWEAFKTKLNELNPLFLNNLLERHQDLSKSEIRLLTLIKIGYSQKEIAQILGIAPDSVKKARSRVRKKLSLIESEKLSDYLHQF